VVVAVAHLDPHVAPLLSLLAHRSPLTVVASECQDRSGAWVARECGSRTRLVCPRHASVPESEVDQDASWASLLLRGGMPTVAVVAVQSEQAMLACLRALHRFASGSGVVLVLPETVSHKPGVPDGRGLEWWLQFVDVVARGVRLSRPAPSPAPHQASAAAACVPEAASSPPRSFVCNSSLALTEADVLLWIRSADLVVESRRQNKARRPDTECSQTPAQASRAAGRVRGRGVHGSESGSSCAGSGRPTRSVGFNLDVVWRSLSLDPTAGIAAGATQPLAILRPLLGRTLTFPDTCKPDGTCDHSVHLWAVVPGALGVRVWANLAVLGEVRAGEAAAAGHFHRPIALGSNPPDWIVTEVQPLWPTDHRETPGPHFCGDSGCVGLAVTSFAGVRTRPAHNGLLAMTEEEVVDALPHLPCFVTNLERRPERWERTKMLSFDVGLDCRRAVAVDGSTAEVQEFLAQAHPDAHRSFGWSFGQLACLESHKGILGHISSLSLDQGPAVVLEDDLALHPQATLLTLPSVLSRMPSDADILWLGHCEALLAEAADPSKLVQRGSALCMHAYAVTPLGAAAILRVLDAAMQSVDEEVRRACVQGNLRCYVTTLRMDVDLGPWTGSVFLQDKSDGISDTRAQW